MAVLAGLAREAIIGASPAAEHGPPLRGYAPLEMRQEPMFSNREEANEPTGVSAARYRPCACTGE